MFNWDQELITHDNRRVIRFKDSLYTTGIRYVYYMDEDGEEKYFSVYTASGSSWSDVYGEPLPDGEPPNCVLPAKTDAEISSRLRELNSEHTRLINELLDRGYSIRSYQDNDIDPVLIDRIFKIKLIEI